MQDAFTLEGTALTKRYTVGDSTIEALSGVDVVLHSGEIVTVLGPSGSGKSTLLYMLSGLEAPSKGKVTIDGRDIYRLPDRQMTELRSKVFGFIFQAYNLIGNMTALENVEIPLRLAREKNAVKKAREMLGQVGLAERMNHRPGQLSGGEQQRVAIARALVRNPRIIFADEPTGNVDSRTGCST